jgi:hypothetical protein
MLPGLLRNAQCFPLPTSIKCSQIGVLDKELLPQRARILGRRDRDVHTTPTDEATIRRVDRPVFTEEKPNIRKTTLQVI